MLAGAHIGDTRAYRWRAGELQQITQDHTLVQSLLDNGRITAAEAATYPRRNLLARAVQTGSKAEPDAFAHRVKAGDRYLICSDGLFNEVDDGQISAVLTGTEDPQDAADALVEMANEAGGRDNITVIVLDVTGDTPPVTDRDVEPVVLEPSSDGRPTAIVATPVGLASPDGTPPVGGWLDDEPPPTTATTPVPPPVSPPEPAAAAAETRRHRVTVRSVLFVVAIVAILVIAFGAITYYGRSDYYVGFTGDQVAVFKGQKGGILWVDPTLDGTYPLRREDLSPAWQQNLDRTISFTSRAAADAWFDTLRSNPAAVPSSATTAVATVPPTTTTPDLATTSTALATPPSGP
jgi:protein phosphatase